MKKTSSNRVVEGGGLQATVMEVGRSVLRLSWAMTVFSAQQAGNLVAGVSGQSKPPAADALDAVADAVEGQFEGVVRGANKAVKDRIPGWVPSGRSKVPARTEPELRAPAEGGPAPPEVRRLRARRREIERRWAEGGLRRTAFDEVPRWLESQTQARLLWLRPEMERLGPIFSCFGRYLSTRIDILAGTDGLLLASLPDRAAPESEAEVRRRLLADLGSNGAAALVQLEADPVESRVLSQTHCARLADGTPVLVKLARTEVLGSEDLALLPHLAGHLGSVGWPLPAARRMIADFADYVRRRLDLRRERDALLRPSDGREAGRASSAPRVVAALSSGGISTVVLPTGAPLFPDPEAASASAAEELGRTRQLTDLWMHLVLRELRIPEELSRREVLRSPEGGLMLVGGLFQPISQEDANALWSYLVGAARDDCDAVYEALRALCTPGDKPRPDVLRNHLRHVVPRRDGRFGQEPPGFPELLLAHWPQLSRHGSAPSASLRAFYRGLVGLRELCGPSLSRRVLIESLQAEQISRGTRRLSEALDSAAPARWAERAMRALLEMTRTLEASSRKPPARHHVADAETRASRSREWAPRVVWLLLAATVVLWLPRLPQLFGRFTGEAQATALVLAGALLLFWIWRS